MQVETFEYEKVKVTVKYSRKPTKKDLEPACINFLKAIEEEEGKNNESKKI